MDQSLLESVFVLFGVTRWVWVWSNLSLLLPLAHTKMCMDTVC